MKNTFIERFWFPWRKLCGKKERKMIKSLEKI